jgi:hypothetical protein
MNALKWAFCLINAQRNVKRDVNILNPLKQSNVRTRWKKSLVIYVILHKYGFYGKLNGYGQR